MRLENEAPWIKMEYLLITLSTVGDKRFTIGRIDAVDANVDFFRRKITDEDDALRPLAPTQRKHAFGRVVIKPYLTWCRQGRYGAP